MSASQVMQQAMRFSAHRNARQRMSNCVVRTRPIEPVELPAQRGQQLRMQHNQRGQVDENRCVVASEANGPSSAPQTIHTPLACSSSSTPAAVRGAWYCVASCCSCSTYEVSVDKISPQMSARLRANSAALSTGAAAGAAGVAVAADAAMAAVTALAASAEDLASEPRGVGARPRGGGGNGRGRLIRFCAGPGGNARRPSVGDTAR